MERAHKAAACEWDVGTMEYRVWAFELWVSGSGIRV